MPKEQENKSAQNIDKMLGKLKRKAMDDGIIAKVRERDKGYVGPSEKKKLKRIEAAKKRRKTKKGGN